MSGVGAPLPRTRGVGGCPVCGDPRSGALFSARDALHGTQGLFHYLRCAGCGTVFQDPRVVDDDLHLLYPAGYYTHAAQGAAPLLAYSAPRPGKGARDWIRRAVRQAVAPAGGGERSPWPGRLLARSRWIRERAFNDEVVDEILPWRTPAGRALDVGCGSGRMMAALARVGWSVEGAEPDPHAAEVARRATGLPVHLGSASSLGEDLGHFDLVVLIHVLEHLPRPVEALAARSRLLAPGGRLVVIAPNPQSLMARWFGPHWYHWDPPRHMVLLPLSALRRVGAAAGLRLVSARTLSRWAPDTWRHSWERRAAAKERSGVVPDSSIAGGTGECMAMAERGLMAAGVPLGEEVVALFVGSGSGERRDPVRGAM